MSLFGALDTAVSGLGAQSAAFTNISDNVANSQTIGFKGTDTRFSDYLTTSSATENESGSVVATPSYQNDVQGTIAHSSNPLAMAISGQGFFTVSQSVSTDSQGKPVFSTQPQYTRAGDFQLDKNGYVVNGGGQYLNAWPVNASGNVNQATLAPLQINEGSSKPVPTTQVTLSANLPATPAAGTATAASPLTTQVSVYDALGTKHQLTLSWSQTATPNQWNVAISSPDATPTAITTQTVAFQNGVVSAVGAAPGTAGQAATIPINASFGGNPQTINLNLGTFGQPDGLTQFSGTQISVGNVTQNGAASGTFTGVSADSAGNILATYSNGQTKILGQVPITTFAAPDGLQRQNDQAYTATSASGDPLTRIAGSAGTGTLATQSVENSNVDIATQLSKVIVAQQAYSANAKMVTTADQLLQQTINMKQ